MTAFTPSGRTAEALGAFLIEERMKTVLCLDTADSTSNVLREMAARGCPDGQIVIADTQTAGRGRLGRSFASPKDGGVYLSALLCPDCIPKEAAAITAWVAVAVCDAIYNACGVRVGVKWVNDLVLNRKKICGILAESTLGNAPHTRPAVIVGIGVNLNVALSDFPANIRNTATSVFAETGRTFSRARLAAEIIRELDKLRGGWPLQHQAYLEAYRNASVTVGREIRLLSGDSERRGFAQAIDDDFGLVVRYDDGTVGTVVSGEVSVRGLYNYAD